MDVGKEEHGMGNTYKEVSVRRGMRREGRISRKWWDFDGVKEKLCDDRSSQIREK